MSVYELKLSWLLDCGDQSPDFDFTPCLQLKTNAWLCVEGEIPNRLLNSVRADRETLFIIWERREAGGSWRSNRKREAVDGRTAGRPCGMWAPQAVPDGWLRCTDQDGAQEAGIYLTKAQDIIAFSSLNVSYFSPWKVEIRYRGNDCQDLLYPCSVQKKNACVVICLGSIFSRFLISNRLPELRLYVLFLKFRWSLLT